METKARTTGPGPSRNERFGAPVSAGSHPARWAALAPAVCAVHCMSTPLLVAFVPALALGAMMEAGLLGVTLALAAWVTGIGLRTHGRRAVWAPVLAGAAIWAASLSGLFLPLPEALTSPVGSLTMAAGLGWNGWLVHRTRCARCAGAHPHTRPSLRQAVEAS